MDALEWYLESLWERLALHIPSRLPCSHRLPQVSPVTTRPLLSKQLDPAVATVRESSMALCLIWPIVHIGLLEGYQLTIEWKLFTL